MRKVVFDIPYTRNGETHTLMEWSHILGIRYVTLCARVRRGLTGEEIFRPVVQNYKGRLPKLYTVDGHTGSLRELCKIYGVGYSTVKARMRLGRTLEQALKQRWYQKLRDINTSDH